MEKPWEITVQAAVGDLGSSFGPSFLEDWDSEVLGFGDWKESLGSDMFETNMFVCVYLYLMNKYRLYIHIYIYDKREAVEFE